MIAKAGRLRSPSIACLGLTFKANVNDIREGPAIEVVDLIANALPEVEIMVADPYVEELPPKLSSNANLWLVNAGDAVDQAVSSCFWSNTMHSRHCVTPGTMAR